MGRGGDGTSDEPFFFGRCGHAQSRGGVARAGARVDARRRGGRYGVRPGAENCLRVERIRGGARVPRRLRRHQSICARRFARGSSHRRGARARDAFGRARSRRRAPRPGGGGRTSRRRAETRRGVAARVSRRRGVSRQGDHAGRIGLRRRRASRFRHCLSEYRRARRGRRESSRDARRARGGGGCRGSGVGSGLRVGAESSSRRRHQEQYGKVSPVDTLTRERFAVACGVRRRITPASQFLGAFRRIGRGRQLGGVAVDADAASDLAAVEPGDADESRPRRVLGPTRRRSRVRSRAVCGLAGRDLRRPRRGDGGAHRRVVSSRRDTIDLRRGRRRRRRVRGETVV